MTSGMTMARASLVFLCLPLCAQENCEEGMKPSQTGAEWNGWGVDVVNSRYQTDPGLDPVQVPRLKLKWAFGFPGGGTVYAQPTIAGGRVFMGSADGTVYALDASSGCTYWTFKAPATVRTAISVAQNVVYFGDTEASMYAVDSESGELLWKSQVESHRFAIITGAPKLHDGRLYVPVSSLEEVAAGAPTYFCCTFRGSVVALEAATGKQIWKTYTIPGNSKSSGAAIWSSPTLDIERKVLYVGTGNAYSDPPTPYSDAVLALDMESGSLRWSRQLTENDGWNYACISLTGFSRFASGMVRRSGRPRPKSLPARQNRAAGRPRWRRRHSFPKWSSPAPWTVICGPTELAMAGSFGILTLCGSIKP